MKKTDCKPKSPPRRSKAERLRSDALRAMLLPPLLCAALCLVCLCGLSWAWFTVSISGGTSSVVGAQYGIDVQVMQGENPVSMGSGGFALSENTEYTVTLTANGTASTGFCVITLKGETIETLSTAQITPNGTFTFTLIPRTAATLTAAAHWGVNSAENPLQNGAVIGELVTPPAEEQPTDDAPETDAPTPSEDAALPNADATSAPSASPAASEQPSAAPSAEPTPSPAANEPTQSTGAAETPTPAASADAVQ